jgi:transcriptional regulator with XRE-family HTH domain
VFKLSDDVGRRLRQIRQERGWSQRELAKRAEVTNSTISLIEQGRVSPSIASLKKVLDGLPMSLAEFFTSDAEATNPVFYTDADMAEVGPGEISFKLLGASIEGRSMQVMKETYPSGSDTGEEMLTHNGEEAGVVVSGEIELTVDGESRVLKEGEGYYFDCRLPHRFRNASKKECVIVSANNPPSF